VTRFAGQWLGERFALDCPDDTRLAATEGRDRDEDNPSPPAAAQYFLASGLRLAKPFQWGDLHLLFFASFLAHAASGHSRRFLRVSARSAHPPKLTVKANVADRQSRALLCENVLRRNSSKNVFSVFGLATDAVNAGGFRSSEIETEILSSRTSSKFSHNLDPEPSSSRSKPIAQACRPMDRLQDATEQTFLRLTGVLSRPNSQG
jgi:hypothetical protein